MHGQQCVERCLQALIIEKGERPDRTHDLLSLRSHAERLGWRTGLSTDDAVFLNSVYKGRYPSEEGLLPHGEPSADEASRAVDVAGHVCEAATKLLNPAAP